MYLDWALIGEPPFFAFGDKGPKDGLAEHPHRRATGRIRLGQSNLPQGYAPADASALPQGQALALVTDDVEAALAQAVQAGARLVSPAKVKPWGQTVGYVCTPDGNLIEPKSGYRDFPRSQVM